MNNRGGEFEAPQDRSRGVLVIVPVFQGEPFLADCLRALLETSSVRILVVDDASSDASVAVAASLAQTSRGRVGVIALERNFGFAGAVNRGVEAALAGEHPPEVVVLVNQDCIVSPGWQGPLAVALEDPSVAAAGARLLDADGATLQHAGARIEANGLTTHIGRGLRDPGAFREAAFPDYVCGALFAFRASTWRRLGAFDESYFPSYFEEVDWCLRARREGLRIAYVPGCEARHVEASCSGAGTRVFLMRYHRSRLRFVVRHLLGGNAWRWLGAELRWLATLRSTAELVPAFRAYLRIPALMLEGRRGVLTGRRPRGDVFRPGARARRIWPAPLQRLRRKQKSRDAAAGDSHGPASGLSIMITVRPAGRP